MRLLLRETAEAAAARFWRDAGATSATAAQSVYMSVYRRRWGAEFALQGARMRIARAYLVTGKGWWSSGAPLPLTTTVVVVDCPL